MQLIFSLALLISAVCAKHIEYKRQNVEGFIGYNYHERFGIPKAAAVRKYEEALLNGDVTKISGGQAASLGQLPYQAGVLMTFRNGITSLCGGSLISNSRVLTAAHCLNDGVYNVRSVEVVLGSTTVYYGGTRITTTILDIHQDYDPWRISDDVGMVYIGWVTFTDSIQAIALPLNNVAEDFVGYQGTASGYGLTANVNGMSQDQVLSYITVPIISNEQCAPTFPNYLLESNICIDGSNGMNICTSDSGGPLAVTLNGTPTLVGVVSFGTTSCESTTPSAFARVTYYLDWITARL